MKKIIVSIMIFLFVATMTSSAGIFTKNEESTGQSGSVYGSGNSTNTSEEDSGFGALFKAPANNPGNRPDNGGGIGQEAPIGNALPVLITCCIVLIIVKTFNRKTEKINKY